jgi:excisionase family DNA binding protein
VEAARLLGLTHAQLNHRIRMNDLPPSPRSKYGHPRYELEDIDNLAFRLELHASAGSPTPARPNASRALVFTTPEVSKLLGIPATEVLRLARTGAIPSMTVGTHILFPREHLLAWVHRAGLRKRLPQRVRRTSQ